MVVITQETINKIKREGRIPHAFLIYGDTENVRRAQNVSKMLTNVINCGVGIIPSLYSVDFVSNNDTIATICQKTLQMIRPHAIADAEIIVESLLKKGMINIARLKQDIEKIKTIIDAHIDEIIPIDNNGIAYHIGSNNHAVELLGINAQKYCNVHLQITRRIKPTYTLRIFDTVLLYDKQLAFETAAPYDLSERRSFKADKIIRPVLRNNWLSKRYSSEYVPTKAEYNQLHPQLKANYSYHGIDTNQFAVDYLFYELIENDYEGLLNPHDINSFRSLMKLLNPVKL